MDRLVDLIFSIRIDLAQIVGEGIQKVSYIRAMMMA
jgi:hypothetical protein